MKHSISIDEAMTLFTLTGKAAAAFRRQLELNNPGAWFVVAGKLKKSVTR